MVDNDSRPKSGQAVMGGCGTDDKLGHKLRNFFAEQLGVRGQSEIYILKDLILLRFRDALSSGEIDLCAVRSGRLLVKELTEKACRQVRPELDGLLRQMTNVQLLGIDVTIFWERGEKLFLMNMSDKVRIRRE